MLNEAQKELICRAYATAAKSGNETVKQNRLDTLANQFEKYGVTPEEVKAIALRKDADPDFTRPVPPIMERQQPTIWTPEEEKQLRVMKEKGVANSEICKQLHKTAQQVSSKWYTLRKAVGKIKAPAPVLDKPAPEPATEPTPQVKPVVITPPTFDLTALEKPIAEHFDIFSTLQDIMRQSGAGYASVSITRQDGTKYRAEVRK